MRLKTIIILIFLLIASLYVVIVMASVGRFVNTHSIVVQSYCIDCHSEKLEDLNASKHIGAMGENQSIVIDNWFILANVSSNVNNNDINGLCMSCHNIRAYKFGFTDPYIYNVSSWGNISSVALINDIVLWNNSWESGIINGGKTETIIVNAKVQDVVPANASVIVDVTVQLMNFSGVQNSSDISRVCVCNTTDMTIVISNAYADYFNVYIDISGAWDFTSLNVTVDSYPSVTINAFNGSLTNFYNLPADLPLQYSYLTLFHTKGNYSVQRMDRFIENMKNLSVTSISIDKEIMTDYVGNISRYTCGTPDSLCHINQKISDGAQKSGIAGFGEIQRYYSHDMPYVTDNVCKSCHL